MTHSIFNNNNLHLYSFSKTILQSFVARSDVGADTHGHKSPYMYAGAWCDLKELESKPG